MTFMGSISQISAKSHDLFFLDNFHRSHFLQVKLPLVEPAPTSCPFITPTSRYSSSISARFLVQLPSWWASRRPGLPIAP